MSGTSLIVGQFAQTQALQTGLIGGVMNPDLGPALEPSYPSYDELVSDGLPSRSGNAARYILGGTVLTLGCVVAGCSDPRPAPVASESALPRNQGSCTPESRDPFCQGLKESLVEHRRLRDEGHHTDQMLTLWLVLGAVLLVGGPLGIAFWRRGRKIKKLQAELNAVRPAEPEAARPGLFSRLFRRTSKPTPSEAPSQISETKSSDDTPKSVNLPPKVGS